MKEVFIEFVRRNFTNLTWGVLCGVAIILATAFTPIDMTAMIGAYIGIGLNKMRGDGNVDVKSPSLLKNKTT